MINPFDPLPIDIGFRPIRFGLLANELLRRGHTVTWLSSDFNHISKEYRRADLLDSLPAGLKVILLHTNRYYKNVSFSRLINHWQYCKQLTRWMENKSAPDGIIVSYPLIEAALISLAFGSRNYVPVIVDIMDIWPEVYLMAFPRSIRRIARVLLRSEFRKAKKVFTLANNCVAVSQKYLTYAQSYRRMSKFKYSQVHYLGCDPDLSVPNEEGFNKLILLGINPSDINFTFIGTLSVSYDIDCLLDTAQYIERYYPRVKYIIGGEGPLRNLWQTKAKKLKLKNVKFIGFVDSTLFGSLLKHSFAGLATYAPGAFQSIPNKPVEYLAFGLPVISSLVGEFEELIERTNVGVSYKAGNVASLIDAIRKLLDDPLFTGDCRRKARELFIQQFLAKNIYSRYVDDLEQLFGGKAIH